MKKIISFLLVLVMVFGLFTMQAFAVDSSTVGSADNIIYSAVADADTSAKPSAFGTSAANGRVWTDKSVAANVADGNFTVTLSALSQEYLLSADKWSQLSSTDAADVLMILDFSSSMKETLEGSLSRFAAMIKAVNIAMKQIMTANKNAICGFAPS